MPKQGQKAITINEKIFDRAKAEAESQNRSVAGWITDLIKQNSEPVEVAKN